MSTLEEYQQLKKKVEKAQSKADKAEGALSRVMNQLEEEFDCSSVEEAKTLLEKMEKKEKKAKNDFEESLTDFEEKWNEHLEDNEDD